MSTLSYVIFLLISSLTMAIGLDILMHALFRGGRNPLRFVELYLFELVACTVALLLSGQSFIFSMGWGLFCHIGVVWVRYRFAAVKTLLQGFLVFFFSMLADFAASFLMMQFFPPELYAQARDRSGLPGMLVANALPIVVYFVFGLVVQFFRLLREKQTNRLSLALRYLRPILLAAINCWIFAQAIDRLSLLDAAEAYYEMISYYVLLLVLLLVSVSYFVQDINYLQQLRRNETLEQQQRVNQALLKNIRVFRHNIANMLFGFGGLLLSGRTDEIQAYYDEMVQRCRLIHNENIVMLQNLTSPALTSLILHQIDAANQEEIPIDVYIQKGIHRRGLSDAQLCQVMGVLLDNAREAARESAAPYISLEMRNIDHSLEVIIRNTFGAVTPTFQQSSKANHEGLGLQSVRDILRTNPHANLNLRAEGQYVVAQMVVDG